MNEYIDFGTLGLKIGDKITFRIEGTVFMVSSGNGTPGNGGTLVSYESGRKRDLFSLKYITKRLMKDKFREETDIFSLWMYQGETLRSLNDKMLKNIAK